MERAGAPLKVTGAYWFVVGIITLFPSLTRTIFGAPVGDPALLLVYAGAYLGLGYLVWRIGSDPAKHSALIGAVLLLLVLHVITFVVVYARGQWTLRTVGFPIIVNGLLAIWVWSTRRGQSAA